MSTDLTKVGDHPAAVIRTFAQGSDSEAAAHQEDAALALQRYEKAHGVTFAALDNDALAAVREAYAAANQPKPGYEHLSAQADADLRSAISDLLGLED